MQLGATDAALGFMAGVIAVVSLAGRPWVGMWVDRGGSVAALIASVLLYTACVFGYTIAASVSTLLVFRAVTGLAVALFATASQTLIVNLAPDDRRGAALSLYSLAYPLAQIVAPPAGVAIARGAGYVRLFDASIAIGLLSAVLAWRLRGVPSVASRRPRRLLFNRAVLAQGLWLAALHVAFGANVALLAVHASRRGLANPGIVFTALALSMLVALIVTSRVSDRMERMRLVTLGLGLAALGMWTAAALHGWALLLAGALSGAGHGIAQPVLHAVAADRVPAEERGSAMATLGIMLEGGVIAGAIGGGLIARAFGAPVMFVLAGLCPAAGLAAASLMRARRATDPG